MTHPHPLARDAYTEIPQTPTASVASRGTGVLYSVVGVVCVLDVQEQKEGKYLHFLLL